MFLSLLPEYVKSIHKETMIRRMKRTGFTLLLALLALAAEAQDKTADTAFVFRFVPHKDVFYVPYADNQTELNRLCAVLQAHIDHLRAGRMYISVSSYAATGNSRTTAQRMAYLRSSRVKSELIQRVGITEQMFVTDRRIAAPYADSLREVVVVAFPASVEKIERIAGAKAAEVVRSYYREIEEQQQTEAHVRLAAEQQKQQELAAREAVASREAEATRRKAAEAEEQRRADAERQRLEAEEQARRATEAAANPYTFALHANLLRWATLTPDLGVEWRIDRNWGILVNGTWTSWSWSDKDKRYALWKISPEVRYYIGKEKRGYLGAMYHTGKFNYKTGETGRQGSYRGGGITGGYLLALNRALSLDFHCGIGYTHADYDKYEVIEHVQVRRESDTKKYTGVNQLGVTLVWKPFE
ncbi:MULTISPECIES: DUF3575 domain-containing protein [Bacteroides]|uniref:DUF3575 domain-containing protein n=1 Tax=Bacteroides TaxID=816 RepID=UPI001CAA422C|nr:DUF3575 domain-containing protein [Bacteroides fragilis]